MVGKLSQQTVKNLIVEASSVDCSKERREEIRGELIRAIYVHTKGDSYSLGGNSSHDPSYTSLVRALFIQTMEHPERLLELLPLFLMMCGNGEYEYPEVFAKIDWSLVD